MKKQNTLLGGLAAVVLALFALGTPTTTQAQLIISDFNNTGMGFTFGAWTQTTSATSLNLSGTGAGSGSGLGLGGAQDYSSFDTLNFTARLGGSDTSTIIQLVLEESDGDQFEYEFASSGLNTSTFTTLTANLATPDTIGGSGDGSLDLTQITQLNIWSNFDGAGVNYNFDVDQVSLTAVPEPSTYALLALGLAALTYARKRQKS